jgi:hypothetical protein
MSGGIQARTVRADGDGATLGIIASMVQKLQDDRSDDVEFILTVPVAIRTEFLYMHGEVLLP